MEDIEKISILPIEYKKKLKVLFLSEDNYNLKLAEEIIKILFPFDRFIFLNKNIFSHPLTPNQCFIKDPSRHALLTLR
jgi:hypothetical protein